MTGQYQVLYAPEAYNDLADIYSYIDNAKNFIYTDSRNRKGALCMAQTNVCIRMDAELKKQFEEFCSDVGMSMTTAFTIFAKKAVREYRIPFTVGRDIPNEETQQSFENVRKGIGLSRELHSVKELMEDLDADDSRTGTHSDLF